MQLRNRHHKDILALILAIAALGGVVFLLELFPDQGMEVVTREGESARWSTPEERGRRIARVCIPCHDLSRERRNDRSGPPLWGLFGQPAGSAMGFRYSPASQEAARGGLMWDEESLDDYLQDPRTLMAGTASPFAGLPVPAERSALIAYLKTLRDKNGAPRGVLAQRVRSDPLSSEPDAPELQIKRGRIVAEQCSACHDLSREKKNIIGPHLWGVVDRPAGSVDAFPYSAPFLEKAGQELRWTPRMLNQFLTDPRGFIPGTRMLFAGVKNDRRRSDLIAYLQTLQ